MYIELENLFFLGYTVYHIIFYGKNELLDNVYL